MLLGVRIVNFDVFDDDKLGLLMGEATEAENPSDGGIRLRNLNALIGRNKTGKTSFIMAMSFIKRSIISDVAQASKADGRPGYLNLIGESGKQCEFKLFFCLKDRNSGKKKYIQYELVLDATKFGSPYIASERVLRSDKTADGYKIEELLSIQNGNGTILDNNGDRKTTGITNEHQTALSIYGRLTENTDLCALLREIERWFFCAFSSDEMSSYYLDGNAPGGHKHLNSHGSNVGNVLEYMRQTDENKFDDMIADIEAKIPVMKKKKRLPANLSESPDKLFLYLLLLRDCDPHSTIFIETPDKDLYHDMVDVLADEMREFTIKHPYSQIVFSTHNPYIVETMNPKEIWVFSRDFGNEVDDSVKISCAGSDKVVNALFKQGVGMGAIWYGGHLDSDIEYDNEGLGE